MKFIWPILFLYVGLSAFIAARDFNSAEKIRLVPGDTEGLVEIGTGLDGFRVSSSSGNLQFSNNGTTWTNLAGSGGSLGDIVNGDISATAEIARTKIASVPGEANYVLINSSTGVMSAEQRLAASRGGTNTDTSASSGVASVSAGVWAVSSTINGLTLGYPTFSNFTNANHDHEDTDDGGTIDSDALTGTIPASKGGTGVDSSASNGVASVSGGVWSHSNTINGLTLGNTTTFSGTISPGTNTLTSTALRGALSDETGSGGGAVFATQPTIQAPTFTSGAQINSGTSLKLYDTDNTNYVEIQAPSIVTSDSTYFAPQGYPAYQTQSYTFRGLLLRGSSAPCMSQIAVFGTRKRGVVSELLSCQCTHLQRRYPKK